MCSRRWPLRLETRRERSQGGVNLDCTGRDSARCGWGVGPCCAPGGRQYGWEPAGSPAGPGRNLAALGGVGVRSQRGEDFRQISYAGMACKAHFIGMGFDGYRAAMKWLVENPE